MKIVNDDKYSATNIGGGSNQNDSLGSSISLGKVQTNASNNSQNLNQMGNDNVTPVESLGGVSNINNGSTPIESLDDISNTGNNNSLNSNDNLNNSLNNNDGNFDSNNNMINDFSNIPGNNGNVGIDPINNFNANGFVEPPKKESIGLTPPDKNEKKPKHKFLFIILVLVLMVGVAVGVYYLLNLSKNSAKVTLKDNIVIPLGEEVPKDITKYATITGTDSNNCTLVTTNINNNKAGKYEYSITCAKKTYKGNVVVKDTQAPKVGLKVIYRTAQNSIEIKPEDFISTCVDPSGCKYSFKNDLPDMNNTGNYEIDIGVTDGYDNSVTVKGIIYIVPYDIQAMLIFTSPAEDILEGKVKKSIADNFAMGDDGTGPIYMGVSRREYIYQFSSSEEYKNVTKEKSSTIT